MNHKHDLLPIIIKSLYEDRKDPNCLKELDAHIAYSKKLGLEYQLEILEGVKQDIENFNNE